MAKYIYTITHDGQTFSRDTGLILTHVVLGRPKGDRWRPVTWAGRLDHALRGQREWNQWNPSWEFVILPLDPPAGRRVSSKMRYMVRFAGESKDLLFPNETMLEEEVARRQGCVIRGVEDRGNNSRLLTLTQTLKTHGSVQILSFEPQYTGMALGDRPVIGEIFPATPENEV